MTPRRSCRHRARRSLPDTAECPACGVFSPFRIVSAADSVPWKPTIEDVNKRRWDYAELHGLVAGVESASPRCITWSWRETAAAGLPVLAPTKDIYSATEQFNRCFAAFLVGGVYCEAINPDGLEFGFVVDWKYLHLQSGSQAAALRTPCRRSPDRDGALAGSHERTPAADPNAAERL
jgi:hypothetical protein